MEAMSIRMPHELRERIKRRAQLEHREESAVVREALERGLREDSPRKHPLEELMELKLTGGPADLSSRIDDYLYGDAE